LAKKVENVGRGEGRKNGSGRKCQSITREERPFNIWKAYCSSGKHGRFRSSMAVSCNAKRFLQVKRQGHF
jgi:hypothetical protein